MSKVMSAHEPHVALAGQTSNLLVEKPTLVGRLGYLASRCSWVARRLLSPFHRGWRRFLAVTRLSSTAICEESVGLGCYDYHTYADDVDAALWFMEGGARCKRCHKQFRL